MNLRSNRSRSLSENSPEEVFIDRRKSPRRRSSNIIQLSWTEGTHSHNTVGLHDFSETGCRILTLKFPSLGTYLPVSILFPGGQELHLEVRVIWKQSGLPPKIEPQVGLMVLQRGDIEKYQNEVARFCPTPPLDRRKKSLNFSKDTPFYQKERRGLPGIKRRLATSSRSLGRWISRYTYERVIQSAAAATVQTQNRKKIMLGSNNYLGLTDHPKVKEAAIRAIEKYGTGAGGVRVLSGTMELHKELEHRLAEFKKAEASLIYSSGYVANLAVLTSILQKNDIVLNDEVNHASIVDGCRSSEATVRFYRHKDLANLEKKLSQYDEQKPKLIITDGVFSMDGDVAPLGEILRLANKHNAMLMVDDAHATGVIGATGRGSAEYCGVSGKIDITTVTLSKALAGVGGAICGSKSLIKQIFNLSKQFIFSSALPPSVCASALAALDVITSRPDLIEKLHENRRKLVAGLRFMGFNVPDTVSAVVPIIIGDEIKTYKMAHRLDELNVFVNAVSRPAVPRELSRLRASVMATHRPSEIEEVLCAF